MLIQDGTVTVFGDLHATGSVIPGSSQEFKQDIGDLSYLESLELIESLDSVSFSYLADPTQPRLGFIAEDVPQVFGTPNRKGVDPMGMNNLSRRQQTEQELVAARAELEAIRAEARRAGVPPGWVR